VNDQAPEDSHSKLSGIGMAQQFHKFVNFLDISRATPPA